MAQDIQETSNELNDASTDRALNTERDAVTTDISQDVDTQERIRTNSVSTDASKNLADVENQRRDRTHYDQVQANNLQFTQQLQQLALVAIGNAINAAERNKNQDHRHADHTLTDLHGSDVNPGAGPGAPTK